MTDNTYNGWKNYETWNCSLWINNDYGLYQAAREFIQDYKGKAPYKSFIEYIGATEGKTGDNVSWISKKLDYNALNSMMRDLKG